MMNGLFKSLCAVTFTSAAGALTAPSCGAADIQVLSQNDTSLSMRFIDAGNNTVDLTFTRANVNELWKAPSNPTAVPGIAFGNPDPTYAGTAQLRALGITPPMAVRTLEAAIADRPMDDVTIFQLYVGEMAVALWEEEQVTEIWYVGSFVSAMLDVDVETDPTSCAQSWFLCCKSQTVPNPGEGEPAFAPNPNVNACIAVAKNCNALKSLACGCLQDACEYCVPTGYSACQTIPGLQQQSEASCVAHTNNCGTSTEPQIGALLGEILDRVQVIYDTW